MEFPLIALSSDEDDDDEDDDDDDCNDADVVDADGSSAAAYLTSDAVSAVRMRGNELLRFKRCRSVEPMR